MFKQEIKNSALFILFSNTPPPPFLKFCFDVFYKLSAPYYAALMIPVLCRFGEETTKLVSI